MRWQTAAAGEELFCRDCNEVARATTTGVRQLIRPCTGFLDGKRCLICGFELERQQPVSLGQNASGTTFEGAAGSVQELQTVVMRLLSQIGGDWNGVDTGARRPASEEAGHRYPRQLWPV
uniref:Uncharacterized protein n=1 Tax=Hyaloperonospora arabidopsidis (strain Emoy2) TaxID=559515 RepID=M4BZT6_HYAAE